MEHNEGSVGRGTGGLAIRIVELNPVRQFDCVFGVVRHPSTEEDKSGLSLLTIGRLVNLEAKMINVPRLSFCVPEMSDVSRNMLDVYAYKEKYLRMSLGSIFKILKVAFL
jgi:hypothetical protein